MNFFIKRNCPRAVLVTAACIILCVAMCSCGQKVINSQEAEVKSYSWSYEGEYGISSTITFEDENAAFTIARDDESCTISGLCIFDESSFIIIDENLKSTFAFEYTLYGDRITLKYDDSSIDFTKVNE